MSLAQFLSSIGGIIGGGQMGNQTMPGMPGMIGGFGGGTFNMDGTQATPVQMPEVPMLDPKQRSPMQALTGMDQQVSTPPDMMEQIARAMPQMQQASPQTSKFTGLRDTLGQIGDYLLQANDMAPIYAPRKAKFEQQQASEAIAQYLGQFDPSIAQVARFDPKTGMELNKGRREDERFGRTARQDDQKIFNQGRQIDLGENELGERIRSNRAGEGITRDAQGLEAQIAQAKLQDAAADRQQQAALKAGDWALARELQGRRENIALKLKSMEGGSDGGFETVSTVVETPGTDAVKGGWFTDAKPATPTTKTTTTRKVPVGQSGGKTVTKAQVTELATQRGMTYAQAEQVARSNGFKVQ